MEIVIAIAIMGMLLTPLLVLQYNVMRRVATYKQTITHTLPLRQFFFDILITPLQEGQTQKTVQKEDPQMVLDYQQQEASGQFTRFKDLFLQTVTSTWQEWNQEKKIIMPGLLFIPQEKEEQPSPEIKQQKVRGGL